MFVLSGSVVSAKSLADTRLLLIQRHRQQPYTKSYIHGCKIYMISADIKGIMAGCTPLYTFRDVNPAVDSLYVLSCMIFIVEGIYIEVCI